MAEANDLKSFKCQFESDLGEKLVASITQLDRVTDF